MLGNISIYWSNFVGNNSKRLSVLLLCTGILYSKLFDISVMSMGTLAFILLQWSKSHSVVSDSLQPHVLYNQWNSPGQNTGVGSLSLLQGIFPTQESNRGLLHCRRILYQLSYEGSPGKITGKTNWRSICLNIYILKYLLICLFVPGAHCGTRDL